MTKLSWGRLLTVKGALLLLISFSLPAFHGCDRLRVPAREVNSTLAGDPEYILSNQQPGAAAKSLGLFLLPYASALIFLFRLLLTERERHRDAHLLIFLFLMLAFVSFEIGYGFEFLHRLKDRGIEAFQTEEFLAVVGPAPVLVAFLVMRQRARGHWAAALVCQFSLALALFGFFVGYAIWMEWGSMAFHPLYGIFVSGAAAALLVAGTFLEWLGQRRAAAAPIR